jgi:hypothetical protein
MSRARSLEVAYEEVKLDAHPEVETEEQKLDRAPESRRAVGMSPAAVRFDPFPGSGMRSALRQHCGGLGSHDFTLRPAGRKFRDRSHTRRG